MNGALKKRLLNSCLVVIALSQAVCAAADIYLLTKKPSAEESKKICQHDEVAVIRHEAGASQHNYEILYCKGINRVPHYAKYNASFSEYEDFKQEMTKVAEDFTAKVTPYKKAELETIRGILNYFIFSHGGLVQDTHRGPLMTCTDKCHLFAHTTTENLGSKTHDGVAKLWTCNPSPKNIFCVTNISGPSDWKPFRQCKNDHGKLTCTPNEKHFKSFSEYFVWKLKTQDARVVFETSKPRRIYSQRLRYPFNPLFRCKDINKVTKKDFQQCDVEKI